MTPPITTERRASHPPPGPEPNTIGNGPMNTTPPVETFPRPVDPRRTRVKPAKIIKTPAVKSFCNAYTVNNSMLISIRTIASTIAMLAHFASEPKTIGIGPIITTPPPLTSPLVFLADVTIESSTTANPRSINTIPADVTSTMGTKPLESR